MAEVWYPSPGVTQTQHERLMGNAGASGVIGYPTDQPVVYAPGSGTREVRIRASRRAIVEGYGWENDTSEIILSGTAIAANTSGSTRTDLIVLRLDRSDFSVRVKVVQGTPGAGAPTPSTSGGPTGTYELPLAEVDVSNNATTITSGQVRNRAWYLGSDGQIRCHADLLSKLPHEAGRTAWIHPTGRYVVSSGDSWLTSVEDSGLVSVTTLPGYSATENTLQRRNGVCVLNLKVQRTNGPIPAGSTTKVANLPDGFTPTFPVQSGAMWWSGAEPVGLRVTSTGVYVVTPAGVSVLEDRTVEGQLVWFNA